MKTFYLVLFFALSLLSCSPKISPHLLQIQELNYNTRWEQVNTYPIKNGRSDDLHFFDKDTGFVINSEGYLSYTEDEGESWEVVLENEGTFFRCITFKNRQEGWLGTIGTDDPFLASRDTVAMYETKDGGITWTPVKFNGPNPKGLCGLQKVSDDVFVGCGRVRGPSYFIKTVDGGANWHSQNMDHVSGSLIAAHFFDKNHGFVLGGTTRDKENCKSMVLETKDGGISWDTVYMSKQIGEYPWKFAFPSREEGYISIQRNVKYGDYYHLQTKDGGKTWKEVIHSKDYYYVQGIGFANSNIGYMGGAFSKTYETRDGGKTWIPFSNIGKGFNNFQFFEDGTAYGVGFGVYKCEDVNAESNVIHTHYESGNLKGTYNIVGSKKTGAASTHYESGKLESEGSFKDNLKIGKWKYYNDEGVLIDQVKMKNGIAKMSDKKLSEFIGTYEDDQGVQRKISLKVGTLYSQRENGEIHALLPETSDQFYFAFNPDIKFKFVKNKSEQVASAMMIQRGEEFFMYKVE